MGVSERSEAIPPSRSEAVLFQHRTLLCDILATRENTRKSHRGKTMGEYISIRERVQNSTPGGTTPPHPPHTTLPTRPLTRGWSFASSSNAWSSWASPVKRVRMNGHLSCGLSLPKPLGETRQTFGDASTQKKEIHLSGSPKSRLFQTLLCLT